MSHIDTWDPKPDAGYDYMGQLPKAIATNVDGMRIGELFPNLAKQADKYSLIRSMTHHNNGHETAAYLMQTAARPGERLAYPSIGAVFAMFKSPNYKGLVPPYVVLTQPQGRFSEEGFLGAKFKPFATGGDPNAARFEVEGMVGKGITDDRQKARSLLREKLNSLGNAMAASPELVDLCRGERADLRMLFGQGRGVFDLSQEKPELRDRYGRNTFGQDCLAARRMVEAGVPYIVISYPPVGIPTATTSLPCAANAPNWTRDWPCSCWISGTAGCWRARWCGAAGSLAAAPGSTGNPPGMAVATIMAVSSPCSLRAGVLKAARSWVRPMPKPMRSRIDRFTRWIFWAAFTSWAGLIPAPTYRIPWAPKPGFCLPLRMCQVRRAPEGNHVNASLPCLSQSTLAKLYSIRPVG